MPRIVQAEQPDASLDDAEGIFVEVLGRFVRTRHELTQLLDQLQKLIEASEPEDPREALRLATLKLKIVRKFASRDFAK